MRSFANVVCLVFVVALICVSCEQQTRVEKPAEPADIPVEKAAEPAAIRAEDLKSVDFKNLSNTQIDLAVKIFNEQPCLCPGCKKQNLTLARCRLDKPRCGTGKRLASHVISAAAKGQTETQIIAGMTKAAQRPKRHPVSSFERVDVGNAPFAGPEHALVTIVEFSEFQCPYCARVAPTVQKIMDDYAGKVKRVFKHNPLPFHKKAPLAAEASMAAHQQGKFWEYEKILFKNTKRLAKADLISYAQTLGLDMEKFNKTLDDRTFQEYVKADRRQALSIKATGTPCFFINGVRLAGAKPYASFKAVIDRELRNAEKLVASGTKIEDLYETIMKQRVEQKAAWQKKQAASEQSEAK